MTDTLANKKHCNKGNKNFLDLCFAYTYHVHIPHMCLVPLGVQKTALDSLKLKLEMAMSCYVGTGH